MALKGTRELRSRIRALGQAFKPLGKDWADETVKLMRPQIPVATGKTRRSVRRRNASMKRATVVGSFVNYFLDKGPVPHPIRPKRARMLRFQAEGRTVFARSVRHPGFRGLGYRNRAARAALRHTATAQALTDAWNEAA